MMVIILRRVLRLIVGGVFIAAGAVKIMEPAAFAADIGNYRLLPHEFINLLAITLPWIELGAGLLLVAGFWKHPSAVLIAAMMVVFLAAIGQAVARGLDVRCGCFGTVEARKVGFLALAQDVGLFAGALWLAWHYRFEDQKK
jgi:putative oxidoreductase